MHNFELLPEELDKFVALTLVSVYLQLPRQRLYWSADFDINTPVFPNTMSRTRFEMIKRFLHFADNNTIDVSSNRFAKVQPLFDITNRNLKQFGIFTEFLSIDEQMVPYRGRHPCRQFIKNKPTRFGYKLWLLSSDDGYPYHFVPYQG